MHYLMSVELDQSRGAPTDAELQRSLARVGPVNDEMKTQGVWVFAGGLLPYDSATVVRVAERHHHDDRRARSSRRRSSSAGFWVIEVDDLDAALAWAAKCSEACEAPIEVRPFDGLA